MSWAAENCSAAVLKLGALKWQVDHLSDEDAEDEEACQASCLVIHFTSPSNLVNRYWLHALTGLLTRLGHVFFLVIYFLFNLTPGQRACTWRPGGGPERSGCPGRAGGSRNGSSYRGLEGFLTRLIWNEGSKKPGPDTAFLHLSEFRRWFPQYPLWVARNLLCSLGLWVREDLGNGLVQKNLKRLITKTSVRPTFAYSVGPGGTLTNCKCSTSAQRSSAIRKRLCWAQWLQAASVCPFLLAKPFCQVVWHWFDVVHRRWTCVHAVKCKTGPVPWVSHWIWALMPLNCGWPVQLWHDQAASKICPSWCGTGGRSTPRKARLVSPLDHCEFSHMAPAFGTLNIFKFQIYIYIYM